MKPTEQRKRMMYYPGRKTRCRLRTAVPPVRTRKSSERHNSLHTTTATKKQMGGRKRGRGEREEATGVEFQTVSKDRARESERAKKKNKKKEERCSGSGSSQ